MTAATLEKATGVLQLATFDLGAETCGLDFASTKVERIIIVEVLGTMVGKLADRLILRLDVNQRHTGPEAAALGPGFAA